MPLPTRRQYRRRFLEPELQPRWESRWRALFANLRAAMARVGRIAPTGAVAYFRDSWVESSFPKRAMVASLAFHALLVYLPVPYLQERPPGPVRALPQIPHTLYLPPRDLPQVRPPGPPGKSGARPEQLQPPKLGADAFHPRQTIVSRPLRPTHPRQTLIQPDAPPEAPKILPPLPNIVEWSDASQPAPPRLDPRALSARQARARPRELAPAPDVAAPQVAAVPAAAGDIPLAPTPTVERPRLAAAALAATRAGPARSAGPDAGVEAPDVAPELAGVAGAGRRLIALSANPAPPAPEMQVPPGNLEAHLSIGPMGTQPGVPWGVPGGSGTGSSGSGNGTGLAGSGPGSGAAGTGTGGDGAAIGSPPGISITGGDPSGGAAAAGPARPAPARPLPERPAPRLDLSLPDFNPAPGPRAAALDRLAPGQAAEQILGSRRIYTLHVNMPNLTSVTGSWVLRFVELRAPEPAGPGRLPPGALAGEDLAGPVPLRKVDPRYPPALFSAKIEGDVILYAIIRQDGSVDSIQLLKGLEPELDRNAMEALARWKFQPAERGGRPVELEAVVTIPFRARAPL